MGFHSHSLSQEGFLEKEGFPATHNYQKVNLNALLWVKWSTDPDSARICLRDHPLLGEPVGYTGHVLRLTEATGRPCQVSKSARPAASGFSSSVNAQLCTASGTDVRVDDGGSGAARLPLRCLLRPPSISE